MSYAIIVTSQLSSLMSSNNSSALQVLILILFAFMLTLLLVLLGLHISAIHKVRHKSRLKKNIEEAVKKTASAKSHTQAGQLLPSKEIFTRRGLAALAEVFDSMNSKNRIRLKEILLKMGLGSYLAEQLDSDNEDYLLEILHLAGELDLRELGDKITQIMLASKESINEQYEAFLALARFGDHDNIVRICLDKNFVQSLSFRSLQEIISAYTGDKPALYKALLTSPDAYITRICIKYFGKEKIKSLAQDVEVFLDNENINLVIDAMRTLSTLSYKPVAEKIKTLVEHERWEVRSVAVNSLASLGPGDYTDQFVLALQDSEWQVRFNAGSALSKIRDGTIREKVLATNDRFALDMLEYMMDMVEIGGAVK